MYQIFKSFFNINIESGNILEITDDCITSDVLTIKEIGFILNLPN